MRRVIPIQLSEVSISNGKIENFDEWQPEITYGQHADGSPVTVKVEADETNYLLIDKTGANNAGLQPKANPLIWEPSPMNEFAFVDGHTSTKTEGKIGQDLFIEFKAEGIDHLSFFGVEAEEIQVMIALNTKIVFNHKCSLAVENLLLDRYAGSVPVIPGADYIVIFKNPGKIPKIGHVNGGNEQDLGVSLYGGDFGLKSFGRHERKQGGYVDFEKGLSVNVMDLLVLIPEERADYVLTAFRNVADMPVVWIGDDSDTLRYNSLLVFGFYLVLEEPITRDSIIYTLRIEGVV